MNTIISINKLIEIFKAWSEFKTPMLNDFGYGPIYDFGTSQQMQYPCMWVDHQTDSTIKILNKSMQPNYSFIVMFLDQINDQTNYNTENGNLSDNRGHIMSDMFQLAQDFISDIVTDFGQIGITIVGDVTATKVEDETQDKVCGWALTIDLQVKHLSCMPSTFDIKSLL